MQVLVQLEITTKSSPIHTLHMECLQLKHIESQVYSGPVM